MSEIAKHQLSMFSEGEGGKRKLSKAVQIRRLITDAENMERLCVSCNADYQRLKEVIEPFRKAMEKDDKIGDYVKVGELTYPRTSLKEAIKRYDAFPSAQCERLSMLSDLVAALALLGVPFEIGQNLYPEGGC